ncbi:hypothetical protein CDAR_562761 [Caerostris darwini]|uniref:Uncharacterized protein n=1 Tax=Caerostris darwini TaxID=1538125 RepID=A0AAV4X9E8_9ARAC|nr:hypothetical protein CDAR_562761 [Caerostris darwini]
MCSSAAPVCYKIFAAVKTLFRSAASKTSQSNRSSVVRSGSGREFRFLELPALPIKVRRPLWGAPVRPLHQTRQGAAPDLCALLRLPLRPQKVAINMVKLFRCAPVARDNAFLLPARLKTLET